MTRGRKIAAIAAAFIAVPLLVGLIAGVIIVRTEWFRDTVRNKIISAVVEGTGGRTEIGSFDFDWTHLRATIRNFVIHGTEPANAAPLFQAALVQVDLKLTSPFKNFVDIAWLLLDGPSANVIVYPDGGTNIPAPKIQKKSSKSGLETVVDLAIRRFDLRNGSFTFAGRKQALDARGQNLRAQLDYNALQPRYQGEISIRPLTVRSGADQPVEIAVTVPIVLEKDKIQVNNARVTTESSQIVLTGSVDHLAGAPRTTGRINARIAFEDARRIGGTALPIRTGGDLPRELNADASLYMDGGHTRISSARLTLGGTTLEASGTMEEKLHFSAQLATGQLERLFAISARPLGMVDVSGDAAIDARRRIAVSDLRLAALGGTFTGDVELTNMEAYRVKGKLSRFEIAPVARSFAAGPLPYDGVISGALEAVGNTKSTDSLTARAELAIAPGRGVPVTGRINAAYNGPAGTIALARSYVALPSTRLDLSGSLGREIQVRLVSHDLRDFQPALSTPLPVALDSRGSAAFTGSVTGTLSAPRVAGHLAVTNFSAQGRSFHLLAADVNASSAGAAVKQGTLARGSLQARFDASLGLRNWKAANDAPLTADLSLRNADLRDLLALAGRTEPVTGTLAASAQISGTLGNPRGTAGVDVVNGTAYQERFDHVLVRANLSDGLIDLPTIELTAGTARIEGNATYRHPADSLEQGTLRAHLAGNQIQLAQFRNLTQNAPGLAGDVQILFDGAASVAPVGGTTEIELTSLNGNVNARGLRMQARNLGDLSATAQTSGSELNFNLNSDFAGSTVRASGRALLAGDHATTATLSIAGLPIEQVLAVAGRHDIPAAGIFSAHVTLSGTFSDPRAQADFTIAKGKADRQPFDRVQANVAYTSQSIEVSSLQIAMGNNRLDFNGSFTHPAGDLQNGQARFHLNSNRMQLAQLQEVQQFEPGLAGGLQLAADGAATLRPGADPLFSALNANISIAGATLNGKPAGELTATATTRNGAVDFDLKSDFAQADIRGHGAMRLGADYPVTAQISFAHVTYAGLGPWLKATSRPGFDALLEGQAQISGPASKPASMRGELQISRLEVTSAGAAVGRKPRRNASLRNDGPIQATIENSTVRIQSFRLTGTDMNLGITGTAALAGNQALDVRADGNVNLAVIEAFDPDAFASGKIVLNAAVRGTTAQPAITGKLQLQNASFNLIDLANGLSNANGTIVFNQDRAIIQDLSGESGGGKITLAGYAAFGNPMQMRVQATAHHVHIEAPQGVSTEVNADLTLAGTTARNVLSGTATVLNVALYSHTDMGSMLNQAGLPPPVSQPQTGLLAGMQLDVRIQTSPNVQFRTSLAQNVQANATLNLRGTPSQPGMLGRLDVSQGQIVFFGATYTIDDGTVSFYDPHKINPYLNVNLETTAKGITVTLNVNGPADRMKLSYNSDPPMQFADIVGLLASGKVPTTDPVLAARQPVAQPQSVEQKGASALLNQAVASPVSGRLQRLFGVTRLQIDPQILGGGFTPQARLSLQQQISKNLVFSYSQDVASSNPQVIRVQWDVSPTWTAIAQRDENGEVALDFFYKKRLR